MTTAIEKVKNFKIEIDEEKILRLIGYKKKSPKVNDSTKNLIAEEKKKLDYLLHPVSIHTILSYEETNKHPIFKNAEKIALCICTIGPELEEKIKELMNNNEMLRALILDAFGSEAVEEVAIQSDKLLAEKARKMNSWPSKRFSPGYGKWDIKEQQFVFQALPSQDIGVRLTESYMMIPQKSISFRINFYKNKKLSTRKIE